MVTWESPVKVSPSLHTERRNSAPSGGSITIRLTTSSGRAPTAEASAPGRGRGRPGRRSDCLVMSVGRLVQEADDLTMGGVEFARGINHATPGSRLSPFVESTVRNRFGEVRRVRGAVDHRLDQLGVTGHVRNLFYLAADMATTAAVADGLTSGDRRELRKLWEDLLSR